MKYCRESLLERPVSATLVVLMLCFLQAPFCNTQNIVLQVTRQNGRPINTFEESEYYILEGEAINFKCHCLNTGIVSLIWKRNGEILTSQNMCDLPLSYDLTNASDSDSGEYVCEATFSNGTTVNSAGRLEVLDSDTILAPPRQFGLIDTSTSLNCSTIFGERNSISISWYRDEERTQPVSGEFDSVALADEGTYVCRVFISSAGIDTIKRINLSVIVPPTILEKPSSNNHFSGNQAVTLPVQFQSHPREETVIAWYKNEDDVVPKELTNTVYEVEPFATTELRFANLRRRDTGLYRVVIVNNFEWFPQELRQVDASFDLEVTVLPVAPSNILIEGITSTSARVVWLLANQNEDDLPDNITAILYDSNKTLAAQYVLDGSETSLPLTLIPGTQYSLQMSAANVDGVTMSEQVEFHTTFGAPHLAGVSVERVSPTSFALVVSFYYTGGGSITQLKVSFRRVNSQAEWTFIEHVEVTPTGNYLEWRVTVSSEAFTQPGVKFQVKAVNARGFVSDPVVQVEPLELPGRPEQPLFVSSTHDSIVVQVELPHQGASSIISLDIDFLNNPRLNTSTIYGNFQPRELVLLTVGDLEASTSYRFTVAAANYGGKGEPSPPIEAATASQVPVSLDGLIGIVLGGCVTILILLIILLIIIKTLRDYRTPKQSYFITDEELGTLDNK